jgi:hypothetical protein
VSQRNISATRVTKSIRRRSTRRSTYSASCRRRNRFSAKELADGAVPNLSIRLGPGSATWTLKVRVAGEGGISKRGHKQKGRPHRLTLGEYPATSIETARGLANTYIDQAKKGISPAAALESSATAGGTTMAFLSARDGGNPRRCAKSGTGTQAHQESHRLSG